MSTPKIFIQTLKFKISDFFSVYKINVFKNGVLSIYTLVTKCPFEKFYHK